MVKPSIHIRVDGNRSIGLGHLYRCIALAQMIGDHFEVRFWSKSIPKELENRIADSLEYGMETFSDEQVFLDSISQKDRPSIVVCDGYHFDRKYQQRVKQLGCKLVCIDDFHEDHFVADAVINHAPGLSEENFSVESYTRLYLGPEYCLLRLKFLELINLHRSCDQFNTVFICFGGADPQNLTLRALNTLSSFPEIQKVFVITGAGFKDFDLIDKAALEADIELTHLHDIDEDQLINSMVEADFAIVPSSTILYETIAARLPVLTGYFVDNQKKIYKGFTKAGAVIGIDQFTPKNIRNGFSRLNSENCRKMIKVQEKLIDGRSPERISKIFKSLFT